MGRPAEEMPRSEPSRGNPDARDRRGACGNVSMMGAGLRPSGKPLDQPPYPKMQSAPHFYPDRQGDFPIIAFDFLGFQFRARKTMWRKGEKRVYAHGFLPAASPKSLKRIRRTVRRQWPAPPARLSV